MLDSSSTSAVQLFITGYVIKTILSVLSVVSIWFVCFPIRTTFNSIKDKWKTQNDVLSNIQAELFLQRTNHLHHIEKSNEAQLTVLKDVAQSLRALELIQHEISGYLRGIS